MFTKKGKIAGLAGGLFLIIALGLFLGVNALSSQPAGAASAAASSKVLAKIVSIAKAIEAGHAEPGWKGGHIPYSWGGGHHSKPGPTKGTCAGYTGSIHPCPATHTVGLDCSGFSRWVYDLAYGKDVLGSGNTDSQLRRMHRVSAKNARPGDLVFFGTLKNTHHVGIYIGHGLMINAYATGTHIQTNHLGKDLVGYYEY